MSRTKKSRSLKRNHAGFKTGSKERTKLESKQRKEKQKLANPRKVTRQRSVYQQHMDNNGLVEIQHVNTQNLTEPQAFKPITAQLKKPVRETVKIKPNVIPTEPAKSEEQPVDLWDQLESPTSNDIF